MERLRLAACLALLLASASLSAQAGAAPDAAASMYSPATIVVIDLTLPPASIEALEEDHDEYQDAGFSLTPTAGTPDSLGAATAPLAVGVRLKGQGSFRALAGKAAFKIKFNHSVKGQKFLGLKGLTLNNMVQDPSMVHEALAYEAFRAAGVAAPRTGYAYVRVNGEDYGLYLNVETLDDVALARWFDSTGHLYEGALGADLLEGGAGAFEVDEGDEEDLADLEALIAAANEEPDKWLEAMSAVADLPRMTRMWAVERYIGHWDSYTGIPGDLWPNNFYLHSEEDGRFSMLPWGTDQAWGERLAFAGGAGLLFVRCLAEPRCRAMYVRALGFVGATLAASELDVQTTGLAALLAPWQQLDPRREHSLTEIEEAVGAARGFIAERPGELSAWLASEASAAPGPAPSLQAGGSPVDPVAGTMLAGRTAVVAGVVTTQLSLPGEGRAAQRVEIRTASGTLRACTAQLSVPGASSVDLRCALPAIVQRRRRARWLRLEVTIEFQPRGGAAETLLRRIRVPRLDRQAAP